MKYNCNRTETNKTGGGNAGLLGHMYQGSNGKGSNAKKESDVGSRGLHDAQLQSDEGPRLQVEGGGPVENPNQTPPIQTHVRPRSSNGSSPPTREHKKPFVENAEMRVDDGSDAQNF